MRQVGTYLRLTINIVHFVGKCRRIAVSKFGGISSGYGEILPVGKIIVGKVVSTGNR